MPTRTKNHEWLKLTAEEAREPDLTICDPHHHLWDLETARIASRYLLDEILEDVRGGHNVVSTVFIECGAMSKTPRFGGPRSPRAWLADLSKLGDPYRTLREHRPDLQVPESAWSAREQVREELAA